MDDGHAQASEEAPKARERGAKPGPNLSSNDRALAEMRDANELLRALSDAGFEAVFMHSEGRIRMANRAAELYSGVGPGELIGRRLVDFIAPESLELVMAKVAAGDDRPYEAWALRADGTVYPVEVHPRTTPVVLGSGVLRVVAMRDLSERRALEERLRQAEKLEAIGRLAAGVAHDFNNLLSVMTNAAELARLHFDADLPADHPSREEIDEVLAAADRGAKLIRQLLAFGRKTELRPRPFEVTEVLDGLRSTLEHLLGEAGEFALVLPDRPIHLRADPVQLEQVLINLVANARDAIPDPARGHVRVSAERLHLDADALADADEELAPGPYLEIAVSDDGVGMDAQTRERAFEPFFTTKETRGGTGLGLATVFGIIRQSGGMITVDSEPGRGSTFTIRLPVLPEPAQR